MGASCADGSRAGGRLAAFVVYCRPEALAAPGEKLSQFLKGLARLPVPLKDEALVVSDNGDIYGTVADLFERERQVV